MKSILVMFAGVLLAASAAADTILFSFQPVQTPASNDVVRAQNFLEQTALNATHKCLNEGLFARKYWIAVVNELNGLLTTPNLTPGMVRETLSPDNLPHERNSEVMMEILLNAHATLYNEFAAQKRSPEVARAFVESLRKGVNAALQAQTAFATAGSSTP